MGEEQKGGFITIIFRAVITGQKVHICNTTSYYEPVHTKNVEGHSCGMNLRHCSNQRRPLTRLNGD